MAKKKTNSTDLPPKLLEPLGIDDAHVRINHNKRKNGLLTVSVVLVDSHGNHIESKPKYLTETAETIEALYRKRRRLKIEALARYNRMKHVNKKSLNKTGTLCMLYDNLSQDDRDSLCPPAWKEHSTRKQWLASFRHILMLLDTYAADNLAGDYENLPYFMPDVLQTLEAEVSENKNSYKNARNTHAQTTKRAKNFNRMFRRFATICTIYNIPMLIFPIDSTAVYMQSEQRKALPAKDMIKFAAALLRLESNGLTVGAAIMLTGMARTSEAAGVPTFGDILICRDYAVYGIIYQASGRIQIADLKTNESYRLIILPKYAVECISRRKRWLLSQGFSPDEIAKMPAVSKANDPTIHATAEELSAFVRQLLETICSCNQAYWDDIAALMQREPDLDAFGRPERDNAAYVLRRNGCTWYINVGGLAPGLVDALLGHKSRDAEEWIKKCRRPDEWPKIADAMENVIFSPDASAHPAFSPIQVTDSFKSIQLSPRVKHRIEVPLLEGAKMVKITLKTRESGDPVRLSYNGMKPIITRTSSSFPTAPAPILGVVHKREYYQNTSDEVTDSVLEKFIFKRKETE